VLARDAQRITDSSVFFISDAGSNFGLNTPRLRYLLEIERRGMERPRRDPDR